MIALLGNELRELKDNILPLAILLATALIVIALTNQLWTQPPPLRTAVIDTGRSCANRHLLAALVDDEPDLSLTSVEHPDGDIWRLIDRNHLDIAISCKTAAQLPGYWIAYASFRNDSDRSRAKPALALLALGLIKGAPWYAAGEPLRVATIVNQQTCQNKSAIDQFMSDQDDVELVTLADMFGETDFSKVISESSLDLLLLCSNTPNVWLAMIPPGSAKVGPVAELISAAALTNDVNIQLIVPPAARSSPDHVEKVISIHERAALTTAGSLWLLPGVALMVSLLLSFYLSAGAIVREIELGTWSALRLAPSTSMVRVLASKATAPIVAGMVSLCLCTLTGAVLGLSVKSQFVSLMLVVFFPAVLATTMQGLFISSLARTKTQALFSTAAYLIGMFMFAGVLVPTDWSGPVVSAVSTIFPLRFALPATQAAMLHDTDVLSFGPALFELLGLSIIYSLLAGAACLWRWRRG